MLANTIDALITPDDDELKGDLRELLVEHPGVARQWLELSLQARPPEVRRSMERYLKNSVDDESRSVIEANFCVASSAVCLLNLIYNAFERDRDLREADALMPAALAIPAPSRVHSYLNVLLRESIDQPRAATCSGYSASMESPKWMKRITGKALRIFRTNCPG